jgi:hypothetical protein
MKAAAPFASSFSAPPDKSSNNHQNLSTNNGDPNLHAKNTSPTSNKKTNLSPKNNDSSLYPLPPYKKLWNTYFYQVLPKRQQNPFPKEMITLPSHLQYYHQLYHGTCVIPPSSSQPSVNSSSIILKT